MKAYQYLDALMEKGRKFLQVRYPIICGAMSWVSEPSLVAAVCNAGAFACLAGGNSPAEILQSQIDQTRKLTDKPFGVNIITISPAYQQQLTMLEQLDRPADFVVFAGGLPKEQEIVAMKARGSKILCFASAAILAERMLRQGADALIIEGSESGGHIGQVSTTIIVQDILPKFSDRCPIFVAGGIVSGQMLAHFLLMGAAGIQMGTRFVLTEECQAHKNFKDAFARANTRDAMPTVQFDPAVPVSMVRAISNNATKAFNALQMQLIQDKNAGRLTRQDVQKKLEDFWIGGLRKAVIDGDVENGSLMAGQAVGLINKTTTVQELIQEILADGEAELSKVKQLLRS